MNPELSIPNVDKDLIRYKQILQMPYCCVPASLSIILQRRELLPEFDQEDIGIELGLTVPEEYLRYFRNVQKGDPSSAGYGTKIAYEEYSLQSFFDNSGVDLTFSYLENISGKPVIDWIRDNLESENDIMVCYDYGILFKNKDWEKCGHVSVIDRIDGENVYLVGTINKEEKILKVTLSDLENAIKEHGASNMGGYWLISNK